MKILVVGQGAREHALAWKAAQSAGVQAVWVAPGNVGTALEPKVQNVSIPPNEVVQLCQFAKENNIDLTIVGPEIALAAGISDIFQQAGLPCLGPTRQAAQLETSKIFAKNFMRKHHIPTARFATFTDKVAAMEYLHHQIFPIVIKADGLAAGKGVVIAATLTEAEQTLQALMDQKTLGEAGHKIVIEEFLTGYELSFIGLVDGLNILPLASSQDYKRQKNNHLGPNTGGMGAYSPVVTFTDQLHERVMEEVMKPTVHALATQGILYQGFLYAGLMISPEGNINVLEYNCRLGDPETQPILMRLQSDLIELCVATVEGRLNQMTAHWDSRSALTVVMVAEGYPITYPTGETISGIDQTFSPDCKIFHAATQMDDGKIVTAGGRVLSVTALGKNLDKARTQAYQVVDQIHWQHCYYRTDIGK